MKDIQFITLVREVVKRYLILQTMDFLKRNFTEELYTLDGNEDIENLTEKEERIEREIERISQKVVSDIIEDLKSVGINDLEDFEKNENEQVILEILQKRLSLKESDEVK
ncbi:MAG: hypothetical protein ACTSUF_06855 [Candidatus Heimdallarchaeaceae archaeon]